MKINRGKRLTIISDDELLYKIPTIKFDDIVGTSDEALPDNIGKPAETRRLDWFKYGQNQQCLNFVINFNDNKINLSDMIEFSDMQPESFANSLANASNIYISDKYLVQTTESMLACVKGDILYSDSVPLIISTHQNSGSNLAVFGKVLILPGIITSGYSLKQVSIDILECINNSRKYTDQITTICRHVNQCLSTLTFEDIRGHKYYLPRLSFDSIDKLIKKEILAKDKNKFKDSPVLHTSLLEIIKLKCYLNESNSIELLNEAGQLITKTVPEVLPTTIRDLLRTFGPNGAKAHLEESFQKFLYTERTGRQNPGK